MNQGEPHRPSQYVGTLFPVGLFGWDRTRQNTSP